MTNDQQGHHPLSMFQTQPVTTGNTSHTLASSTSADKPTTTAIPTSSSHSDECTPSHSFSRSPPSSTPVQTNHFHHPPNHLSPLPTSPNKPNTTPPLPPRILSPNASPQPYPARAFRLHAHPTHHPIAPSAPASAHPTQPNTAPPPQRTRTPNIGTAPPRAPGTESACPSAPALQTKRNEDGQASNQPAGRGPPDLIRSDVLHVEGWRVWGGTVLDVWSAVV